MTISHFAFIINCYNFYAGSFMLDSPFLKIRTKDTQCKVRAYAELFVVD